MKDYTDNDVLFRFPIIVDIENVHPNDWNPNTVAPPELKLLETSIQKSGFCFPIIVIQHGTEQKYTIIDGYHRWTVLKKMKVSKIPVIVISDDLGELMSATIRFNRAKGEHQILEMSSIVGTLFEQGMKDNEIMENLGMDRDEVLRLKQNSGMPDLFSAHNYNFAWE